MSMINELRELARHKLLDKQGYRCAICQRTPEQVKIGQAFHLDHCHKTNLSRGLLCRHCNVAIGMFDDNPARLRAALRYLRKWAKIHQAKLQELSES